MSCSHIVLDPCILQGLSFTSCFTPFHILCDPVCCHPRSALSSARPLLRLTPFTVGNGRSHSAASKAPSSGWPHIGGEVADAKVVNISLARPIRRHFQTPVSPVNASRKRSMTPSDADTKVDGLSSSQAHPRNETGSVIKCVTDQGEGPSGSPLRSRSAE